jgi:ribosomal protein S18 acetylase RimI-like enzyme
MFEQHNATFEKIQGQYPPKSLYYLEIAAVQPDTQGMGVGGKLMSWVVDQIGNSPCFLECTNPTNVAFYERYGFKLVEEGKLQDEADSAHATSFYYMVREKTEDFSK